MCRIYRCMLWRSDTVPREWKWSDVYGNRKSMCNQSASTWSIFMVTYFSWYLIQSRITVFATICRVPLHVCNAFDSNIVQICTATTRFFIWIIQIYEICWKAIFFNADTHTHIHLPTKCLLSVSIALEIENYNSQFNQSVAVASLTNPILLHNYRFLLTSAGFSSQLPIFNRIYM